VNVDAWEHYGNYLIGASLMACSLYFIICESYFVQEQDDGSFVPIGCACHGGPVPSDPVLLDNSKCHKCTRTVKPSGKAGEARNKAASAEARDPEAKDLEAVPEVPETEPLLGYSEGAPPEAEAERQSWWQRMCSGRDMKGAILGVFQGLCCPLGLLGLGFLVNLHAAGIAVFLVVFVFVSAFGNAVVAASWACLTSYGTGSKIPSLTIYRVSCGFTFTIGAAWILCNMFHVLEKLDYTEGLEAR